MPVLDPQLESYGLLVHKVYYAAFFNIKQIGLQMFNYNHGRHSVYSLTVHLVFVCKRRGKVFNAEHLTYLRGTFNDVAEEFDAELIEFNGEQDHVHLLISYPPTVSVSALVNSLKGVSSRKLKLEFPEIAHFWSVAKSRNTLWSPSYFASSAGGATIDRLKTYIEDQKSPA